MYVVPLMNLHRVTLAFVSMVMLVISTTAQSEVLESPQGVAGFKNSLGFLNLESMDVFTGGEVSDDIKYNTTTLIVTVTTATPPITPITTATVSLYPIRYVTSENLDGLYVFPGISAGIYDITVTAEDYEPKTEVHSLSRAFESVLVQLDAEGAEAEPEPPFCGNINCNTDPKSFLSTVGDQILVLLSMAVLLVVRQSYRF